MKQTRGIKSSRKTIAVGYALIVLLIGGIVCTYISEWRQLESLEAETRHVHTLRQNIHEVYVRMVELSLIGETVMEWDEDNGLQYHTKRMEIDSLLCGFKITYPSQRIDSVRHLLADKEKQLNSIVDMLEMQEDVSKEIAQQVPAITRKIAQQPKKKKRGGFLGLFGKKSSHEASAEKSAALLHTLNNTVIAKQRQQSLRLAEFVDSLTARNGKLNLQLKELIKQMNAIAQQDLQQREQTINETKERGYLLIGGLTGFVLLMLLVSYIVICRDATRIRHYRTETDRLIKRLKHSLQENKELLVARKNIMLMVTHDLRTPLTAIGGYAELISQNRDTAKNEMYAQPILQATGRMVSLLNTLLSFFRLDSGKEQANSAPFRLKHITDMLEADFRQQATDKGLELVVESRKDAVVIGDKERILQIGYNLLSNALKFTEKGSVLLKTDYDGKIFTLTVGDTGTGIKEELQDDVFTAFKRLSNAAVQDGFGLGLTIVQNLVKLLYGMVTLQSTEGKGSTFTVKIPMELADEAKEEQTLALPEQAMRSFSVLVLDNDDVLLTMTHEMFVRHGIACDTCLNVCDLMERLRSKNYDLLITDLKMQEMNGYEVLELLRTSQIGNSKDIPVVLATASGSCTEQEVLDAGFSALLNKPFSLTELLDVARKSIGEIRQEERPDLSSLLAYGNKEEMLDKLLRETEKDMERMTEAGETDDRKALDELVHHLRSSWAIIRADKPLWDLHTLLHRPAGCSGEEIHKAVSAIMLKGESIMAAAQEKRKEAEDGEDIRG